MPQSPLEPKPRFRLDHIMIETDRPEEVARAFSSALRLPYAWPLMESADYSSIGVNVGDCNLEFIQFRKRFGELGKTRQLLSGVCYTIDGQWEDAMAWLGRQGFACELGERSQAHTTMTLEKDRIFPTIFFVQYHFDTSGWKQRLAEEFCQCQGGSLELSGQCRVELAGTSPDGIPGDFFEHLTWDHQRTKHRIVLESSSVDPQPLLVLNDLFQDVEFSLEPRLA